MNKYEVENMKEKQTYCVKYKIYNVYEDKLYTLINLVDAYDENEAYNIAEEMSLEIQEQRNREAFPTVLWFNEIPYFTDEELTKAARNQYKQKVYIQKRNEKWFLYDEENRELETLEVGMLEE